MIVRYIRIEFILCAFSGTLAANIWLEFLPWHRAGNHPRSMTVVAVLACFVITSAVSFQTLARWRKQSANGAKKRSEEQKRDG